MARMAAALAGLAVLLAGCGGYSEEEVPQTVLLPGETVDELWCYRTLARPECFMGPQPGEEGRLLVISDSDEGSVAF